MSMNGIAFELPVGSKKYEDVRKAVMSRYDLSKREMQEAHKRWQKAEEQHMLYVPLSEEDKLSKQKREQEGEDSFVQLVVPYSYAMVMTAHTYLSTVFLSRQPVLQFMGRHGESEQSIQAVETIMAYQTEVGQHLVPYYLWLLDPRKYGIGIMGVYWEKETITRSFYEEVQEEVAGVVVEGKTTRQKKVQQTTGYDGARLYNVRPWDFFPDPRVPISNLQKGEFCGCVSEVGWNTIVRRAKQGYYFNLETLQKTMRTRSERDKGFERGDAIKVPDAFAEGQNMDEAVHNMGFVQLLEMYVDLIPKDWGLGNTDWPEKWVFTVANYSDSSGVLIGAQPMGEAHDKFPYFILQDEVDGYNLMNRSMYDRLEPMQRVMDWLVNTHFFNIRRSLNDMILADPSRVMIGDFLKPGPGKFVRAKPAAYGTDVRTAVHQFQVNSVTNQHLADTKLIADLMQRCEGINDNVMGTLAPGRRTATESRQANTLSINRLKTKAEYDSAMGFGPLSQCLVQMTQQHFDKERAFRMVGDQSDGAKRFLQVTPEMISGFYDYLPVDGNMPIDRFAQVSLWNQLLAQMAASPQLSMQYDMSRIFAFVAQLAGLRNINQFKTQVLPDVQVANMAAQGKIVPMGRPNGDPASMLAGAVGAGAGRTNGSGPAG